MTQTEQNFTAFQGQTQQVSIPCVDAAGSPIDLTGAEVHWRLLEDPGDAVTDALIHKATTLAGDDILNLVDINANTGEVDAAQFKLVSSDTSGLAAGLYYHELYEIDALSDESPLATGWLTIRPSPAGRA